MKITNHYFTLLKKLPDEIIHERFILASEYQGHFGGKEMQSFTAYFGLSLKPRKIKLVEILVIFIASKDQNAFDNLSQQILVVKRDISSPIFQRKNNPGPQTRKN